MKFKPSADNMKPLVSIIIPTKDRSQYAASTIQACLSAGENIEVIVADSSQDERLLESLKDSTVFERITYIKTDPEFSVVDNFNEAISHTTGEYAICIGDDDFVTSEITVIAKYAKTNQIDCVNFTFPVTYLSLIHI
jgi:glycosyltransferase involved in cell wall biosynthesis